MLKKLASDSDIRFEDYHKASEVWDIVGGILKWVLYYF